MSKYTTPAHQNISVWARRARLDMDGIDLDAVVRSTGKYLGTGRRGAIRWVACEAMRTTDLLKSKQFTARCLGMAIGDMVYEVVYGGEPITSINVVKMENVLGRYEGIEEKISNIMQFADVAIPFSIALVEARNGEKEQAKHSLVAEVLRKARGV